MLQDDQALGDRKSQAGMPGAFGSGGLVEGGVKHLAKVFLADARPSIGNSDRCSTIRTDIVSMTLVFRGEWTMALLMRLSRTRSVIAISASTLSVSVAEMMSSTPARSAAGLCF